MRPFYTQIFLLLATGSASAQDTMKAYLNEQLQITRRQDEAVYSVVAVKSGSGWDCAAYYPGKQGLAFNGHFKDKALSIRNGWFTFYYPGNRRFMCSGRFDDNIPVDTWQYWYENGQKKDSGQLREGKKTGLWKEWHRNGRLQTKGNYVFNFKHNSMPPQTGSRTERRLATFFWLMNQPDVKDGLWMRWHDNGQVQDSLRYENGLPQGVYRAWHSNGLIEAEGLYYSGRESLVWRWYYSNGRPRTEETYENGKIKSMKCYDSSGAYTGDFCSINKAAWFKNGGAAGFEQYLENELKFPQIKLPWAGEMKVRFIISETGVPGGITVEGAPYLAFETEIKRVLAQMPAWDPAIFHNLVSPYEISLVIPFAPSGVKYNRNLLRFPSDTQRYHEVSTMPFIAPYNGW
jgi:antitoxin component YwqK of YwqJK toxin-antitoxin module